MGSPWVKARAAVVRMFVRTASAGHGCVRRIDSDGGKEEQPMLRLASPEGKEVRWHAA